jgi:hypothetical protein
MPSIGVTMRKFINIVNESYNNNVVHNLNVEEFMRGYVEALLATTHDNADESGGNPLSHSFSVDDLSPEAVDRIQADCRSFLHMAGPYLTAEKHKGAMVGSLEAHAGHDFWLTRAGHGAGFWDGDWEGEDDHRFAGPIMRVAKGFPHIDAILGDDGQIHLS